MKLFTPLYPPEGGPLMGFRCLYRDSAGNQFVFYTVKEPDMKRHLWMKHKLRLQMGLYETNPISGPNSV